MRKRKIFVPPLKNSKRLFTIENSSILTNLEDNSLSEEPLGCNSVYTDRNAKIFVTSESTRVNVKENFSSNLTESQNAITENEQILNSDLITRLRSKSLLEKNYQDDYKTCYGDAKNEVKSKSQKFDGESLDQHDVNLSDEFNLVIDSRNLDIHLSQFSTFFNNTTKTEFSNDIIENDDFSSKIFHTYKEVEQCDSSQHNSFIFKQDSATKNCNTDCNIACNPTLTDSISESESSKDCIETCSGEINRSCSKFTEHIENNREIEEIESSTDVLSAKHHSIASLKDNSNGTLSCFCSDVGKEFGRNDFFDRKYVSWDNKIFYSDTRMDHKSCLTKGKDLGYTETLKSHDLHFDELDVGEEIHHEGNHIFEIIKNSGIVINFNKSNENIGKDKIGHEAKCSNAPVEGCNLSSAPDKLELCTHHKVDTHHQCQLSSPRESFPSSSILSFPPSSHILFENRVDEFEESIFYKDTSRILCDTGTETKFLCDRIEAANNQKYIHGNLKTFNSDHKTDGNDAFRLLSLEYSEISKALFMQAFPSHIKSSHVTTPTISNNPRNSSGNYSEKDIPWRGSNYSRWKRYFGSPGKDSNAGIDHLVPLSWE